MKTTEIAQDTCPECGKNMDRATSLTGDHVPAPGDITVCIKCAKILKFSSDMKLEKKASGDLDQLSLEQQKKLLQIQCLITLNPNLKILII